MKPIKIFMTSWNRKHIIEKTINFLYERTRTPFELHVYDNGSRDDTKNFLLEKLNEKLITSLHLDNRNTGCLYDKFVFHSMVENDEKYYVVTDNDIMPPQVSPVDWLGQMITVMDREPKLAALCPQMPLVGLMGPEYIRNDLVICKAVGNFFKVVRRDAFPVEKFVQKLMAFGDDGWLCQELRTAGWEVAFLKNMYCYNLEGDYNDWGYIKEDLDKDPRKAGYGKPVRYLPLDWNTLTPPPELRF